MDTIKQYNFPDRDHLDLGFRVKRMEAIYDERKGQKDEAHRHDFYTLLLINKASGSHIIDFQSFDLGDFQIYFVSPGQVHQLIENHQSNGYVILFSEHFLVQNNIAFRFIEDLNLFNNYGFSPPLDLQEKQYLKIAELAENMLEYYDSSLKFKEQALASLLKLILIQCNNICQSPLDNPHGFESGYIILNEFKSSVDANFNKSHAVKAYADQLNITADHLNRTIKLLIGKTAKEYIQSKIILEAKRLLYFTELSNKEIGFELGFSEPANFSSFFKKCTGQSPSEFNSQV